MADNLGDLELLVLLAVARLGGAAHTVGVRAEIESRTRRDLSRGAVYVTLDRLERKGLLRSHLGAPTAQRGGKAQRHFALAPGGMRALRAWLASMRAMLDGLPREVVGARPHAGGSASAARCRARRSARA